MPGFTRPVSLTLSLSRPAARIPISPLSLAHPVARALHSTAIPHAAIKASEASGEDGADGGWRVNASDLTLGRMLAGLVFIGMGFWIDYRVDDHIHPVLVSTAKLEEKTAHLEKQNNNILSDLDSLKANVAVLMDRTDRKAEEKHENGVPKALKA